MRGKPLIWFFMLMAVGSCGAILDDAIEVIKLAKEVGEEIFVAWDSIHHHLRKNGSEGVDLPVTHRWQNKLLSQLSGVTRLIEKADLNTDRSASMIMAVLLRRLPENTRLELRLNELSDYVARIDTAERQMMLYSSNQEQVERLTLEDFATWAVSHEPGAIPGLLERIRTLTVPESGTIFDRGILDLLVQAMNDANPDLCNLQQSPHQLLYTMYNRISLTEIKGYAMMQFSWMLLKLYGKGNFTQEATLMRERYEERTALMATAIKQAMAKAKRDMYRCDPEYHQEGETFVQITRLLQGYIENEVDMNPDGTCRENCAFYTLTKNFGCFKDQYCARQAPCSGRILNCQYVDSDMWVCPATRSSGRRYEWIEYENGRTLGKAGSCMRGSSKVDSWWRWVFWHCSYCMCICDQPDELSDRFFSLHESVANVKENKVITGIRFKKENRVIHLQINEGILLEHGNIDQRSLRWQPINAFDPDDSMMIDGIDYHTLTYEKRAVDLDELPGLEGHVLTGVRFRMLGAHLHLEIRVTRFNYTSGKLNVNMTQWLSNDNTDGSENPRKLLPLDKPDIPTRKLKSKQPVDSTHDQYMEFTHTDFDADAAQTTVPFIDTQIVMPSNSVPLTGAGLYHRGERGSGGFIAPKVYTYDFSPHMKSIKPNEEYVIEERIEIVPSLN